MNTNGVEKKKNYFRNILITVMAISVLGGVFYYATLAGMYKGAGKLLVAKWVVEWKLNYPNQVTTNDCSATWSPPVNGQVPYMLPLYPEVEAAYWMLPMSLDPEVYQRPVAYRLQGQFPYARYMSFHTYDAITGDYVVTVKDVDIVPDTGSVNPFHKGVSRDSDNRQYTLWLAPEGASLPQLEESDNVLRIPKDVIFAPSVLRVYRPDEEKGMDGGVSLPQVMVFDAQSGSPVNKCAPLRLIAPNSLENGGDKRRFDRSLTVSKNIRHYRSNGAGFYPNAHNAYLVSEFDRDLGDFAVLKWKSPTTPNTKYGGGQFSQEEELRYWSFCLGGENATNTSHCLVDDEALVDSKGYVRAVLGPKDDELMTLAKNAGINYIPWGIHYRPLTILRHMKGEREFENSVELVPDVDINTPLDQQGGELFIGGYSPSGYYCSEAEFKKNFCNIDKFEHPGAKSKDTEFVQTDRF